MGYSIAIRVRSDKLGERMVAFMGQHYRKWSDVIEKGQSISSGPVRRDLDYDHAKMALGFDYASHLHGWERTYVYSVLRWMAIKVGKRKRRFNKDTVDPNVFKKPVPFMVYDGYESWPILVCSSEEAKKLPSGQRWCAMDRYGCYMPDNESLTMACEELFFNKAVFEAFAAEVQSTIGQCPDGKGREAWLKKHQAIRLKHCKPEINLRLPQIRKELERLDTLWEAG